MVAAAARVVAPAASVGAEMTGPGRLAAATSAAPADRVEHVIETVARLDRLEDVADRASLLA
jgi:hypothetical protein